MKPVLGFILPERTGYRTVLVHLKHFVEERYGFKTLVLDCRDFPRDDLRDRIRKCFGECPVGERPDVVFVGHGEFIVGLHRLLKGIPAVVLADFSYKKLPGVKSRDYRRLTDREFLKLDSKREKLNRWIKSLSQEEKAEIVLRELLARDAELRALFRKIKTQHRLAAFGMKEFRAYLEGKFGREAVLARWNFAFFRRYVEHDPVMSRLRFNELTYAAGVFFWSKDKWRISGSSFPGVAGKFYRLLPFMPLPKRTSGAERKLKFRRFLVFARSDFNTEGELSAVRLLKLFPREYSLDIVGIRRDVFLKGLREVEDGRALRRVLPRVRFHVGISGKKVTALLKNALFSLKFNHQGANSMGVCESLAYGVPVICIRGRMEAGILRDGKNALLFDHDRLTAADLESLSAEILSLSGKPASYRRMSVAAFETGRKFDIEFWAPRILKKLGFGSSLR